MTVKTHNPFDTNEALVNKGGNDATLVGGSKGNAKAIQASAEARATKRKDDTQAAAQREKQKTITALLKAQIDAVAAIARLDDECEGDVDRLHIPELVAIIGNKTFQMPKTGQKRDYYRVIVKDLLKDNHGARDFNVGMLEVQAPTEDDWEEEEGIIEGESYLG